MPTVTIMFTGLMLFARHANDDPVGVVFVDTEKPLHSGHHGPEHLHDPVLYIPPDAQDVGNSIPTRRLHGSPIHLAHWERTVLARGGAAVTGPNAVDRTPPASPPAKPGSWASFEYVPKLQALFSEGTVRKSADFEGVLHTWNLHGGKLQAAQPVDEKGENPWTWIDNWQGKQKQGFLTDVSLYTFDHDGAATIQLAFQGSRFGLPDLLVGLSKDTDVSCSVVCHPVTSKPGSGFEIRHLQMLAQMAMKDLCGRDVRPYSLPAQCPDDPLCPAGQVEVR